MPTWTEKDFLDLVKGLVAFGTKFAISERDSDFVFDVAKANDLNVVYIKEKRAIKGWQNEILIVNYELSNKLEVI